MPFTSSQGGTVREAGSCRQKPVLPDGVALRPKRKTEYEKEVAIAFRGNQRSLEIEPCDSKRV
jgi:hypothetical protein